MNCENHCALTSYLYRYTQYNKAHSHSNQRKRGNLTLLNYIRGAAIGIWCIPDPVCRSSCSWTHVQWKDTRLNHRADTIDPEPTFPWTYHTHLHLPQHSPSPEEEEEEEELKYSAEKQKLKNCYLPKSHPFAWTLGER